MEDWLAVLQTAIARSISEEGQTMTVAVSPGETLELLVLDSDVTKNT